MHSLKAAILLFLGLFTSLNTHANNDVNLLNIDKSLIEYQDFPKKGVKFIDISGLLANPKEFSSVISILERRYKNNKPDAILAMESRGFIFATPLAQRLGIPVVMVRKPSKLPGEIEEVRYKTEYSYDTIQIQKNALQFGANVIIIDDLLATGGTAKAAVELANKVGANVLEFAAVIELKDLKARNRINTPVYAILTK